MADKDKAKPETTDPLQKRPGRTAEDRIAAASALGAMAASDGMSDAERRKVHDFLETLSDDAELRVRAAVAHAIAEYPLLPTALAHKLAQDVVEVSGHVLELSPVLTDSFLVELIESETACEQALSKIAKRDALSETVADRLLKSGTPAAVETVLTNPAAQISEDGYAALLDHDALNDQVLTLIAERHDLTAPTVKQCHEIVLGDLFSRAIGQQVRDRLIEKYSLPPAMAAEIIQAALADTLASATIEAGSEQDEFVLLAGRIHAHGDLTPAVLLRMVCAGALDFAKAALHVLTGRTPQDISNAINGAGTDPLGALYLESGLDPYFRFALVTAIKRMAQEPSHSGKPAPERAVKDIVREIVDFYRTIGPSTIDNVITRLCHEADRWRQNSSEPAARTG